MVSSLHFQVDSRLATLLGQEYSSSERALKELIDNAWDADAESVIVALPLPLSNSPIVIQDDGSGMTEEELRRHYLKIASDRRSKRGDRTSVKQRRIKGRKGIGKFAGLMAACDMKLETWARGRYCWFVLRQGDLAQFEDIEELPLVLQSESCDSEKHGTCITLTGLHQGLNYPDPNKLRQILLQEYGRHEDFTIVVDGKTLDVDDVSGTFSEFATDLPAAGSIKLRFSISDGKAGLRQPGIVLRVDGKAVGKPSFFGLDNSEDFPPKLLKKLYGEIDANGLREHVTAGWDALVENSELLHEVEAHVQGILRAAFKEQYGRDMQLAQARLQRTIHDRLAALPEHKRTYADRAIKKVLGKYYLEPESKVEAVVFVLLEALERSDYRALLEHIADADVRDISLLADFLNDFALADMACLVEQASVRNLFLDQLERLALDDATHESKMHKSIESALWIFGPEYSLFSSNITLKRQVEEFLGKKYQGEKANERPDLLLNEDLNGKYLLIEFKRPNHGLNHDDYSQATKYRHEFGKHTQEPISVLIVGGHLSPDFPRANLEPGVSVMTFRAVISSARRQVQWLLRPQT